QPARRASWNSTAAVLLQPVCASGRSAKPSPILRHGFPRVTTPGRGRRFLPRNVSGTFSRTRVAAQRERPNEASARCDDRATYPKAPFRSMNPRDTDSYLEFAYGMALVAGEAILPHF